jgi:molecular chaperone GrpE
MTPDEHTHSRSGPGSTTGARAGAHGLGGVAADATGSEPLPLDPSLEYVAKPDHDAVVEQLSGERYSLKGDLHRIAADFENYKRRAAREREQASAAAESRLLGELLTVIDDTERAIDHAGKDDTTKDAVTEGLRTVRARLTSVVSSHGLERVEASTGTTFDPNLHEAMMVQPGPNGEPDDTILQELQSGWKLGERVLRHARVIVAGGG